MPAIRYTRADCMALLQNKQLSLRASGLDRFPQRSDFEADEVVAIKAFLGPWPRALEAAGLKEPPEKSRLEKNREKRARAKKRRKAAGKAAKAAENEAKESSEEA
ncbi:MAG: homing endonuclease associated repeat-containing protein [Eubacteriales bacterium]